MIPCEIVSLYFRKKQIKTFCISLHACKKDHEVALLTDFRFENPFTYRLETVYRAPLLVTRCLRKQYRGPLLHLDCLVKCKTNLFRHHYLTSGFRNGLYFRTAGAVAWCESQHEGDRASVDFPPQNLCEALEKTRK